MSNTPSSTSTSPSTTTSTTPGSTSTWSVPGAAIDGGGGVSSSLYLFTFLITIVVLGIISAGLLLRAYYVRRNFRRRVEEAIRAGQPLPHDAATALGLTRRGKKEKKHGPMPGIWEAQMWRDGEKWENLEEKREWDSFTPLSVSHTAPPAPPPPEFNLASLMPVRRGPWFLRPFITPRLPDLNSYIATHPDPLRPELHRTITTATLPPVKPAWTIPEDGEEVVVGVLIAMPVEGASEEMWDVEEDAEETEVPEVCLGVMDCTVRSA